MSRIFPKKELVRDFGIEIPFENLEELDVSGFCKIFLSTPIGNFPMHKITLNFKRSSLQMEATLKPYEYEMLDGKEINFNLGNHTSIKCHPFENKPMTCSGCVFCDEKECQKLDIEIPSEYFFCSFWREK